MFILAEFVYYFQPINFTTFADWRPRRTMVFCSWGAEEYGLIGSNEWTQQFAKVLSQRAVAYLNVDVAVGGQKETFRSRMQLNVFLSVIYRQSISIWESIPNASATAY